MVVEDGKSGVPRGAYKKRLIVEGRWIKVELLHRNMTSTEVKQSIQDAIKCVEIFSYTILKCVGQQLIPGSSQMPDGNAIIESVAKRKGNILYVRGSESNHSGLTGDNNEVLYMNL